MSNARFDVGFEWQFLAAWPLVSIVLFLLIFAVARGLFGLNAGGGGATSRRF